MAAMRVVLYRSFVEWVLTATGMEIAGILEMMSVRMAALSPSAEINVRRAAAALRQEA